MEGLHRRRIAGQGPRFIRLPSGVLRAKIRIGIEIRHSRFTAPAGFGYCASTKMEEPMPIRMIILLACWWPITGSAGGAEPKLVAFPAAESIRVHLTMPDARSGQSACSVSITPVGG